MCMCIVPELSESAFSASVQEYGQTISTGVKIILEPAYIYIYACSVLLSVLLIGSSVVFQSTLLNKLTATHSESASYEFTTLTCIPGVIEVRCAHMVLTACVCVPLVLPACLPSTLV